MNVVARSSANSFEVIVHSFPFSGALASFPLLTTMGINVNEMNRSTTASMIPFSLPYLKLGRVTVPVLQLAIGVPIGRRFISSRKYLSVKNHGENILEQILGKKRRYG